MLVLVPAGRQGLEDEMSADQYKETIREFFRTLDRRDLDQLDRVLAADYQTHFPGVPGPLGMDGARGLFGAFFAAFPDMTHTVEEVLVEGDRGAARLTIQGTNTGEFQGTPATGKHVSFSSMNTYRLANGKIAEHWVQYDAIGMLQQMGLIPANPG
jgi:steroid delta-isomerase-like uncharacterized protein